MATRQRTAEPKRGRGAPTKYSPKTHPKQVYKLALLGCSEVEIADVLGVSKATITTWKGLHQDFLSSLTRGRTEADADVAHSLYRRAIGYSHPAVKILQHNGLPLKVAYVEHYPPDTAAATIWLSNRQRGKWSRTPQTGGNDEPPPDAVPVTRTDSSVPEPGA